MYNKTLNIFCIFLYAITYSQTDIYNIKNTKKFDSVLNIKKKIDKEKFKKAFFQYRFSVVILKMRIQLLSMLQKNIRMIVLIFILKLQIIK